MMEKVTLDMLTQDSVSIKTQKYTIVEGQEYEIGLPHRKAYINSTKGRQVLLAELQEPYKSAVIAVWGSVPTINESIED